MGKRNSLSRLKTLDFIHNAKDKNLKLLLPPVMYAIPGIEINVYFRNIFLTVNPDNFAFQVDCTKGSCYAKRWCFVPEEKDIGVYDWSLSVSNDEGIVERATMKLLVAPQQPDSGLGKHILMIGDSLTDQSHYIRRIHELLPNLAMLGSHAGAGEKTTLGGIAHEGYGGWSWAAFANEAKPEIPEIAPYRTNKFVAEQKDGSWKLDFSSFFKRYQQGFSPDIVTIQLGTNDIVAATDETINETISEISSAIDRFLEPLRKAIPDSLIGIGLVPTPANQDAFGANYQCRYHSWQYRKNAFALNHFYLRKIQTMKNSKIQIIPTYLNLDTEHNYPLVEEKLNAQNSQKITRQNNALHPAVSGYYQIADTFLCWLTANLQ